MSIYDLLQFYANFAKKAIFLDALERVQFSMQAMSPVGETLRYETPSIISLLSLSSHSDYFSKPAKTEALHPDLEQRAFSGVLDVMAGYSDPE